MAAFSSSSTSIFPHALAGACGATVAVQTKHLAPAERCLEPLPHHPYVKLNRPYGKSATYLVHSKTLERVVLPGDAEWHIVFDSDGFGAMESEAGEVLFLDELCRLVLCRGDSGALLVSDRTNIGIWSLTAKLAEHEQVEVDVNIGVATAKLSTTAFLL